VCTQRRGGEAYTPLIHYFFKFWQQEHVGKIKMLFNIIEGEIVLTLLFEPIRDDFF